MVDLFTYVIYIGLLFSTILLTSYHQKKATLSLDLTSVPKLKIQHLIALIVVSLIVGFRYEVGVDWQGYKDFFETIKHQAYIKFNDQPMELGFFYINKIIAKIGLTYEWMFFTIALITWYFFFKSVPRYLLPLFIFFLFVDEYFFWGMNGIRQFAAISISLFATRYIISRKFTKYILLILLASLFHRSALVLALFYFIPYNKLYKKQIWLGLFVISLIVGTSNTFVNLIESITIWMGEKLDFLNYTRYIGSSHLNMNKEIQGGWGFYFKVLINFLIIIISGKIIKQYPQTTIYFILFFIGTILFNLSYNVQLLGRINNYFLIMRPVVLAISTWYLWKIPKYRIAVSSFCFLYFLLFIVAVYNSSNMCSPYRFSF